MGQWKASFVWRIIFILGLVLTVLLYWQHNWILLSQITATLDYIGIYGIVEFVDIFAYGVDRGFHLSTGKYAQDFQLQYVILYLINLQERFYALLYCYHETTNSLRLLNFFIFVRCCHNVKANNVKIMHEILLCYYCFTVFHPLKLRIVSFSYDSGAY